MRDAFINTLSELAANDPKVMLVTGDLGFGVFDNFSKSFPKQFLNVGIAEQNMIGVSVGMALEGYKVFCYSLANFPTLRCLEQIRNDACYHNANVKIVSMGGGFSYGSLGISHHATEDLSIMRSLPNLIVVSPCDDWEASEATKEIALGNGTYYLRLDKSTARLTQKPSEVFKLGKSRCLREGQDITLIGIGGIVQSILTAAEILAEQSVSCRVISMHTIKPIDKEAIFRGVEQTKGIITIEENTILGGLGGAVAELCLENQHIPKIFHRIGLNDCFSSIVGTQDYLRSQYEMDASAIASKVLNLIHKSKDLL
jgi:transketolase